MSQQNLHMLKQTGALARNNGTKAVFTKCTANYCKQTNVKCFVHAQGNEVVNLYKRIFREKRIFYACSAIIRADGTAFSQDK